MQPEATTSASHAHHHRHSGIIDDQQTLADKKVIMKDLKSASKYASTSRVMSMMAGPLVGFGLVEAARLAIPVVGMGAALTGVLVAGAAIAAVAILTDYIGTRKSQSTYFDNQEAISKSNARHTAQDLVQEMENHNLCITQKPDINPQAGRPDGKSWVAATCPHHKAALEAHPAADQAWAQAKVDTVVENATKGAYQQSVAEGRQKTSSQQNSLA